MTIAQLKETLLGKVLLQLGVFGDGTSFGEQPISKIRELMSELGMEKSGNEILYNGMTGEQVETEVFFGPAFYQSLKHMVNDKAHSRSYGPMVVLTRQPAEGRARDGGLRFGEMERDCMISVTVLVDLQKIEFIIHLILLKFIHVKVVVLLQYLIQRKRFMFVKHVTIELSLIEFNFHMHVNYCSKN